MAVQAIFSPTMARQNFFGILKQVNEEHAPVIVNSPKNPENEAVLIGKADYDALIETMALLENGQLQSATARAAKPDGYTDITNGVDWDNL